MKEKMAIVAAAKYAMNDEERSVAKKAWLDGYESAKRIDFNNREEVKAKIIKGKITMQIQWTSIHQGLPQEGVKVYVQGDDFVAQAYYHEGMYWQDANVGTKRYAINAVSKWCDIDHAQSVIDSHMDGYYEQKRPNGKIHVYTPELQQAAKAYADGAVGESEAIHKLVSAAYLAGYSDAVDKVVRCNSNEQ